MKNYLLLHYGFEKPTQEIMDSWKNWFSAIADKQVDRGGLRDGTEFSHSGAREIPFDQDSITGYTIIEAENLQDAREIASECPVVKSTRVYEIQR